MYPPSAASTLSFNRLAAPVSFDFFAFGCGTCASPSTLRFPLAAPNPWIGVLLAGSTDEGGAGLGVGLLLTGSADEGGAGLGLNLGT